MRWVVVCLLFAINVVYFLSNLKEEKQFFTVKSEKCLFVGGFTNLKSLNTLQQRFFSLDIDAKAVFEKVSTENDFLVFLDVANPYEQTSLMQQLRADNIENYAAEHNNKIVVYLGVFINQDLARAKKAEVANLGYKATLTTVARVYNKHWLKIDKKAQEQISKEKLTSILKSAANIEQKILPCNQMEK